MVGGKVGERLGLFVFCLIDSTWQVGNCCSFLLNAIFYFQLSMIAFFSLT